MPKFDYIKKSFPKGPCINKPCRKVNTLSWIASENLFICQQCGTKQTVNK